MNQSFADARRLRHRRRRDRRRFRRLGRGGQPHRRRSPGPRPLRAGRRSPARHARRAAGPRADLRPERDGRDGVATWPRRSTGRDPVTRTLAVGVRRPARRRPDGAGRRPAARHHRHHAARLRRHGQPDGDLAADRRPSGVPATARGPHPAGDRAAQAGRDAGGGRSRARRLPRQLERTRRRRDRTRADGGADASAGSRAASAAPPGGDARRRRSRHRRAADRRWARPVDRLRQPRQPRAGACRVAASRIRHARRARRQPCPPDPADGHRGRPAVCRRRRHRPVGGPSRAARTGARLSDQPAADERAVNRPAGAAVRPGDVGRHRRALRPGAGRPEPLHRPGGRAQGWRARRRNRRAPSRAARAGDRGGGPRGNAGHRRRPARAHRPQPDPRRRRLRPGADDHVLDDAAAERHGGGPARPHAAAPAHLRATDARRAGCHGHVRPADQAGGAALQHRRRERRQRRPRPGRASSPTSS